MRIISLIILTFAVTSCSVTRMSDVVPETCGTPSGKLVIGDENTSYAPIVSKKSCRHGHHCDSVVGVQVYNGKLSKSGSSAHASVHSFPAAGHAFALGGSTLIDPYSTSAHYGLGGNVGLSGFSTLPYTPGLVSSSYRRPALVLNSASAHGLTCGQCVKTHPVKKTIKRNYEIQK